MLIKRTERAEHDKNSQRSRAFFAMDQSFFQDLLYRYFTACKGMILRANPHKRFPAIQLASESVFVKKSFYDSRTKSFLPLNSFSLRDSYGNRTRVTAVKGRCLNRLTKEPYKAVCFLTALVVYQMYFYLSRVFYIYFYIIFIVIIFILS